jgi:hypothetical protein
MNVFELQDLLLDSLWDNDDLRDDEIKRIRTFQDVGMLIRDAGLVITTSDGSEFHLAIRLLQENGFEIIRDEKLLGVASSAMTPRLLREMRPEGTRTRV